MNLLVFGMRTRMDNSVHIQVQVVKLNSIWIRLSCLYRHFDTVYLLNLFHANEQQINTSFPQSSNDISTNSNLMVSIGNCIGIVAKGTLSTVYKTELRIFIMKYFTTKTFSSDSITFSSIQCTITEGYFFVSHRKNAGTPMLRPWKETKNLESLNSCHFVKLGVLRSSG